MNTSIRARELDRVSLERAEQAAKIFSTIPADKEVFFLAIANAYLDGLIAGQELKIGESTI